MIRIQKIDKRNGFTLVELIVVLMILVGLAAVLIPAVTDMVARTNASTATANIAEVANSVQRYETQFLEYPNNLDSLKSDLAVGTDLDTLAAGLNLVSTDVTVTAALLVPLTVAGITDVGLHTAGDDTFELPASEPLVADSILKGLSVTAQQDMGLEITGVANKYVLLGIGNLCELNGKTNIDAPVYFPENGTLNPDLVYGRFIAVFQITDGILPLRRAKLRAIISPTGTNLNTGLSDYFAIVSNN